MSVLKKGYGDDEEGEDREGVGCIVDGDDGRLKLVIQRRTCSLTWSANSYRIKSKYKKSLKPKYN